MADFGSDAVGNTTRIGLEGMKLLARIMRYLVHHNDRKLDREIKKAKVAELLQKGNEAEALKYLSQHRGEVRVAKLMQTNERLMCAKTKLSAKELKSFNEYSLVYGLSYAAIADKVAQDRRNELKHILKHPNKYSFSGNELEKFKEELEMLEKSREEKILVFREKDIEVVADITARMNKDIKFFDFNNAEENIKNNPNLSEEEKAEYLNTIKNEKEKVEKDFFDKFNEESNANAFSRLNGEGEKHSVNLDVALVNVTNRIDQEPCYICERKEPNNYIAATAKVEEDKHGQQYINTEYEVYKNGIKQKCDEFSHGKFTHYSNGKAENRTSTGESHWENMKKEIKQKGEFSNDLLIFRSKQDYEAYKEHFQVIEKKVNREDSLFVEADSNSYQDLAGIINNLQGQLENHNLALNAQKELCNRTSGQKVLFSSAMTDDEKLAYMDGKIIAERIANLERFNELQVDRTLANEEKGTVSKNEEAHLHEKIAEYDSKIHDSIERENELKERQIELLSLVALNEIAKADAVIERNVDDRMEAVRDSVKSIAEWKEDIAVDREGLSNVAESIEKTIESVRE